MILQIEHAQHDLLARQLRQHRAIELRLGGLDRDLVDRRRLELGQERIAGRLVLDHRAVAEAKVHRGHAIDAFNRPVDRGDAEPPRLVRIGLQERLVELDHVGARREQLLDFFVQRDGAVDGDGGLVLVVLVEQLLRHGERAGNRDPDRPVGVGAQERHVPDLHRLPAPDLADDPRHDLNLARRARGNLRRVVAVHAVERGGEAVGVAFAPHLAIGDDVDAGALLVADRQ